MHVTYSGRGGLLDSLDDLGLAAALPRRQEHWISNRAASKTTGVYLAKLPLQCSTPCYAIGAAAQN